MGRLVAIVGSHGRSSTHAHEPGSFIVFVSAMMIPRALCWPFFPPRLGESCTRRHLKEHKALERLYSHGAPLFCKHRPRPARASVCSSQSGLPLKDRRGRRVDASVSRGIGYIRDGIGESGNASMALVKKTGSKPYPKPVETEESLPPEPVDVSS